MKKQVSALLPHLPLWAGLLAVLLTLPALKTDLFMDDYIMMLTVRGDSEVYESTAMAPLDLFSFFDGQPEKSHTLMDLGFIPWWTDPEIKAIFWRPASSLTHFLEFRLWGQHVWLMHLNSVLIYGILAALAAILYRRWLSTPWAVVLAAVFFATDHTNATPVLWIANRNILLAAVLGLLALWAHDRWRRDSWQAGPFVAMGAFVLSLLSSEAGISICAYFFAHAVFLDREKLPKALLCLAPYAIAVVAWRIAWTMQGYGVAAIGLYTDPLNEPLAFLGALGERIPILFLSQWALPPADVSLFLEPETSRIHLMVALSFMALVAAAFWPVLRRNRTAGFFLTGMLLSLMHESLGEDAKDRDFILINPPVPRITLLVLIMREAKYMIRPRSMRTLAPGKNGVTLTRIDKNTLLLRPHGGFYAGISNSMMSHKNRRMDVGNRVELRGMAVEVTEVDTNGHPLEARFIFDLPIEDPSLVFLQWEESDYKPLRIPPIGTTVEL